MNLKRSALSYLLIILCISTPLFSTGNTNNFELSCAMYRELNIPLASDHWHNGLFLWFYYLNGTAYMKGLEQPGFSIFDTNNDDNPSYFYESVTLNTDLSAINTLKNDFVDIFTNNGSLDYNGAFGPDGDGFGQDVIPEDFEDIVTTATSLQAHAHGYTFDDMIDKEDDPWDGTISDIKRMRCDGITEFCYEDNAINVSRNLLIASPGNSNLDTHNDFHNGGYDLGELCPKIQAGELGNDSNLENLTSNPPSLYNISTTQGSDYIDINFDVSDDASVKSYIMIQVRKKIEIIWRVMIDNNSNEWKWKCVDLTDYSYTNKKQYDSFSVRWEGDHAGGSYQDLTDDFIYQITVIDQGANYDQYISTIYIDDDFTISSGNTLVIDPGTTVKIAAGKKIIVQGTLIADGTADKPIVFDKSESSSWYGIKFENSSVDADCILNYCTIKNASYAVYCNNASPTIQNSEISYNFVGIYGYYGTTSQLIKNNEIKYNSFHGVLLSYAYAPILVDNDLYNYATNLKCYHCDYSTTIRNNKIHHSGSTSDGVYLEYSDPTIIENLIYDNGRYGVYVSSSSDPEFLHEDIDDQNNVVAYNGSHGIYIDNSSLPILGGLADGQPAHNSFYGNSGSYDVYNADSSTVTATYNWWGQSPPSASRIFGNVTTSNYLSTDPNVDPHNMSKAVPSSPVIATNDELLQEIISDPQARSLFDSGLTLERESNESQAKEIFDQIITDYPDALEAVMALARLGKKYVKKEKHSELTAWLESIIKTSGDNHAGKLARSIYADLLIKDNQPVQAEALYKDICEKNHKDVFTRSALFDLGQLYINTLNNERGAREAIVRYEELFGVDENLIVLKAAMGESVDDLVEQFNLAKKNISPENLDSQNGPDKFVLNENYPNPFNPETSISFHVPRKDARVRIEILNILGQKVITLLDRSMPRGEHVLVWDGKNAQGTRLSAGVYICTMTAETFSKSIKMTLLP